MRSIAYLQIKALALVAIMLFSTTIPYDATNSLEDITDPENSSKSSASTADVPVWRVGDKWKYAGTFDPTQLVIDSGVEANVGE
ncbi:MAG TPA: hypothetical protein HA359_06530, partial [Candidatus Poseidoniaceae archaeon]